LHIYNVWNDDLSVDVWVYDPAKAIIIRDEARFAQGNDEVMITRYEEDEFGNVNINDRFVRMTDAALLEAIANKNNQ